MRLTIGSSVIAAIAILSVLSAHADEVVYAGTVVSASDGQPISGSGVAARLYGEGGSTWVSVETDAEGRFELRHEGSGNAAQIVAAAVGYAVGHAVTVPGRPATIELSADLGSVTGIVLGDGDPIEGAEVFVTHFRVDGRRYDEMVSTWGWESTPHAITGADGRFEVTGLPQGSHVMLRVSAPGWVTWYWPSLSGRVPVGDSVTIRLEVEAAIEGRVVMAGEPVAGVEVCATPWPYASVSDDAVSDEEGRYRIGSLRAGTWRVQATDMGDLYARDEQTVSLTASETATVDIELADRTAGPVVSGTVTFVDTAMPAVGAEIGGASINHYSAGGPHWAATCDEQGRYQLRLPPGPVVVGYTANLDGYDGQGAEPQGREMRLTADGATVDFVLHRTGEAVAPVPCFVFGPDREPVAGALVFDGREPYYGPPARKPIVADEQGRFTMSPPVEDDRILLVTDPERRCCALATVSRDTLRLEVNLEPAAWAVAKIVDMDGQPVPGIAATAALPTERAGMPGERDLPVTGVSDEQGEIRIGPLPPGQSVVFALPWVCKAMAVEDAWEGLGEIALDPGETWELADLVLNPAGRVLEGRVLDLAGEPVSGATVLSTSGIFTKALTTSGEDGRFRLEGLRTLGEVQVVAFSDDGMRAIAVKCDPDDWPRLRRTLPARGEPHELGMVMTLEPLAAVTGDVVDLEDEPVAGAEVEVTTFRARYGPAFSRQVRLRVTTLTTQEGTWRVEGLMAGLEYRAYATDARSPDAGMAELVVPSSIETQSLRLRLQRR